MPESLQPPGRQTETRIDDHSEWEATWAPHTLSADR